MIIKSPNCEWYWNKEDNDKGIDRWTKHAYVNDSVIDSFLLPDLTPYTMNSWYPAFLKIEGMMYPVLFRSPIKRKYKDYQLPPDWVGNTFYRPTLDCGPSIEENEICVSRNVMEAMIWQGHMPYFTMKNGYPEVRSVLDSAQNCNRNNTIDIINVIPYDFTDKMPEYFDVKANWLNEKFNVNADPYHENPFIDSIDEYATKGIVLTSCNIGEQGRTEKIDMSSDNKRMYNTCYFLSFTSYGTVNVIFDRQKLKNNEKNLNMETKPSIEDQLNDYKDYAISIGSNSSSTVGSIVIDKSGVSIDKIDDKKNVQHLSSSDDLVEVDDELLI